MQQKFKKIGWSLLIILSAGLLISSLLLKSIELSIISLILTFICKKKGYTIVFKEYDQKKLNKLNEIKERRLNNG